jgi:hypothetical protein
MKLLTGDIHDGYTVEIDVGEGGLSLRTGS